MIPIDDAVSKAMMFAKSTLGPDRTEGLRLEEIQTIDRGGGKDWVITLSMYSETLHPALSDLLAPRTTRARPRDFKTFTIDGATGELLSMKIRELAGVE